MPILPKLKKARGFTLIELMVAISIVGIMSTIGIVIYSSAQITARDAKRKQDLTAIQTALELYYQTNRHYPCTSDWVNSTSTSEFWINNTPAVNPTRCTGGNFDNKYINQLPRDPKNTGSPVVGSGHYGYAYYSNTYGSCVAGRDYVLVANLENTSDSLRNELKNYKFCGSELPTNGKTLFSLSSN